MTSAEWQALLTAFLEGRLSADGFARRYVEAWRRAEAVGAPIPAPIRRMAAHIDAFEPDPGLREPGDTDEGQLLTEARLTLGELLRGEDEGLRFDDLRPERLDPAHIERDIAAARARADAAGRTGLYWLYIGCGAVLAWLAVSVAQLFAASAQVQTFMNWDPVSSTFAGIALLFVPIAGGVVAFFGAKDVWGMNPYLAGVLFLFLPALFWFAGFQNRRRSAQLRRSFTDRTRPHRSRHERGPHPH